MEKQQYENMKELRTKVENGTATFAERNIWNIIQKKKIQHKQFYIKTNE
jgi:hypothetical protein